MPHPILRSKPYMQSGRPETEEPVTDEFIGPARALSKAEVEAFYRELYRWHTGSGRSDAFPEIRLKRTPITALWFLNVFILQWFFIRLARVIDVVSCRQTHWTIIGPVVPLTGWRTDFIGRAKGIRFFTLRVASRS